MTGHMSRSVLASWTLLLLAAQLQFLDGFSTPILPSCRSATSVSVTTFRAKKRVSKIQKITSKRRKQLGIRDDEDEYDLEMALDSNTDPIITKIIAGSLILSITALLIYGIVIPAATDYGEGVCNPLLTGGRC